MYKKYFKVTVLLLLMLEFAFVFLTIKSYLYKDIRKIASVNEINKEMFAMYIKNEETGEYDEITHTNEFPTGYRINKEKTMCVDNKGNTIDNLLKVRNDKVTVTSNKTVFCYLYFDEDKSVYQQVKSDVGNGALLLDETKTDEYPVYYYSGEITNNNIMYGGFCWKMLRTTETGGVKLVYNGKPQITDEGISCNNIGEDETIGSSKFNDKADSLAYAGYMYNTIYTSKKKTMGFTKWLIGGFGVQDQQYYYGDSITYNNGTYTLNNEKKYTWADNYTNLVGYYTCFSSVTSSCDVVYYIVETSSGEFGWIILEGGNDYNDVKIKLAESIISNEDKTYTLVDSIDISKKDWYENYATYNSYYICEDLISETCNDMLHIYNTKKRGFDYVNLANNYKYGNSFEYDKNSETYTLIDTPNSSIQQIGDWYFNSNTLSKNHYTCFNTSGTCTNLYYIYYKTNTNAYYITLTGGKSVNDAIDEMLYADDVNKKDSTIKEYIDNWYEENLLESKDTNGLLYSKYLENTIFCANRALNGLSGFDSNGEFLGSYNFNFDSFECENKLDRFSLKTSMGGTEGYGNNALDYPIGLISYKEFFLAKGTGFLKPTGYNIWLISPTNFMTGALNFAVIRPSGSISDVHYLGSMPNGVRPVVSLGVFVDIVDGDGSYTNPYNIKLAE